MKYPVLLLFLYTHSVLSNDEIMDVQPCGRDDSECVQRNSPQFFAKLAEGVPEHGIDRLDPLTYSTLTIQSHEKVITHLSHLNITGLGKTQLDSFVMNKTQKSVEYIMRLNMVINSDVKIKFTDPVKEYSGSQTIKARAHVITKYKYDEKVNEDGVAHYEMGPEVINCDTAYVDDVTMNKELKESLENDSDLKNKEELNALNPEFWKNSICKVADFGVAKIVQNIRLLARLLPTSSFVKDP